MKEPTENDSDLIKMPEQLKYISPKKPERPKLDWIIYIGEGEDLAINKIR